jgi:hypothetical protein
MSIYQAQTSTHNELNGIHSSSTHHPTLTLTVRTQVHGHQHHSEFDKCFYKRKEREAINGKEKRKKVVKDGKTDKE